MSTTWLILLKPDGREFLHNLMFDSEEKAKSYLSKYTKHRTLFTIVSLESLVDGVEATIKQAEEREKHVLWTIQS